VVVTLENWHKPSPPLTTPLHGRLVAYFLPIPFQPSRLSHGNFVQADVLDRRPNNGEATGLRGEHINLIGALAHITKETFNGIGGLNMSMHIHRELVKRQGLLFFLC
jgi:hypothetical protein